jgi:hypothetical protein
MRGSAFPRAGTSLYKNNGQQTGMPDDIDCAQSPHPDNSVRRRISPLEWIVGGYS